MFIRKIIINHVFLFMNSETADILVTIKLLSHDIKHIKNTLVEINERITTIEKKMENVSQSCNNMDRHIGSIETIYNILRTPMQSALNYSSRLLCFNASNELPCINDGKKIDNFNSLSDIQK